LPLHTVQEYLIEQSLRGQQGGFLRFPRPSPSTNITYAVHNKARPIDELNVVETAVHQDVRRAMQLPADDIERYSLRPARHQNQYRCQNKLPQVNPLPEVSEWSPNTDRTRQGSGE
jgi:hypothetical protein